MSDIYWSTEGRSLVLSRYAELLRRWPVPNEQRRVSTREGETFVVACGPASGLPVVLLQGSGANAAMWMGEVEALAAVHRVYAVDVPGEPGFSSTSRFALASDACALWLDDVMLASGLRSASFAGVSLGGWMALDYAMRRTDRVDRVVAINPSGVGRRKIRFLLEAGALMLLGERGRRQLMMRAIGPAPGRPHPLDREIGSLALLISKHFRHRREPVPIFSDEDLKRLTMPLLAIVGARDALLDAHGTNRRLSEFAPGATVRVLPDCGHVVRGYSAMLAEFLAEPRRERVGAG